MRGLLGGLVKSIEGNLGSVTNPNASLIAALGGGQTVSGAPVSDVTAMRIATVYACVRIIAEDVAKLPVNVWRTKADGSREEAKDQPLWAILKDGSETPNRWMTVQELLLALMYGLGFRGNGIGVILRDRRGVETGIVPVQPGRVSLLQSTTGTIFYQIARAGMLQEAMLAGKPLAIPDYDVIHLKGLTPDGVFGFSPLTQLREAMGLAITGEAYSASLMRNQARPAGLLKTQKSLTEQASARMRESWDRAFGQGNSGKTAVLEEGLEWQALGMTSIDAQFLEQRRLTIEEIARGFRVPLHMLGVPNSDPKANVEQQTRNYYDQVLMPALRTIETKFKKAFNLPAGVEVQFDVDELLRADFAAQQAGLKTQSDGGVISKNEWRKEIGRNPVPGGDVYSRPLNTAYVDADGKVVMVTPPGGKGGNGPTDPQANPDDNEAEPK